MTKALVGFAAAFALMSAPALANDLNAEITTANQHAEMAASSADIGTVHAHLHHVINCVVGPKGDGYDSAQLNPCQNQGAGAMIDATSSVTRDALQKAVSDAQSGLASNDLATAKKDANNASTDLRSAQST